MYDKNDLFWCYSGHEWGGVNNTLIVVPSQHVKKYLTCAYDFLQDSANIDFLNRSFLNTERFYKLLFNKNDWKIGKMQINAFITASSKNEITTWAGINYNHKYNVFFKYAEQLHYAFAGLNQYQNNEKWTFIKEQNKFMLMPPNISNN